MVPLLGVEPRLTRVLKPWHIPILLERYGQEGWSRTIVLRLSDGRNNRYTTSRYGTPCRNRTHIFGLGDRGPVQLDEGGMEARVGIEPTYPGLQPGAYPLGYRVWYSRWESNPHAFYRAGF